MAQAILMTPGVYFQEFDLSSYIKILSSTLLGLVGIAQRGAVNEDLLITDASQIANMLGIPSENYPALKVLENFFKAGGSICHFVRVTNGEDAASTATLDNVDGSTHTTLTASETGTFFDNLEARVSYSAQVPSSVSGSTLLTNSVATTKTIPNAPVVPGTVQVKWNNVTTPVATDNGAGVLVFTSAGALVGATGTVNYNTGVVSITPASGFTPATHALAISASVFSNFNIELNLVVLDDNSQIVKQQVIESFAALTLANYVAKLSTSLNLAAPEDAPATFPIAGVYNFSGGDDGADAIDDSEFVGNNIGTPTGLQVFANPDSIDINLVCIPGNSSNAVAEAIVELCSTQRADAMGIIDGPVDATVQTIADWANAEGDFSDNQVINSTYAALYFPWYSSVNNVTNSSDLVPPSAAAIQAYVRSDSWQAPAGPNRGIISDFAGISLHLAPGDRLFLGQNRINPLSNFKGLGTMVLGQQTATLSASSLDRVGSRRMLLAIEKATSTAMYSFLFEANDAQTWSRVENEIQPYLDSLVNASQIYAGHIYCDSVTNTVENVNNNIMVGYVILQLLKFAEIIVLNFETTAFGTTISESLISANTISII